MKKKQGTIILKADIINFEDKTIERKQLLSVNKNDQPHNYKGLKTSSKINIDYSKDLLISYASKRKNENYVFIHFFNENLIEKFNSKSLIGSKEARNVKLLDIKQHNNKAYVLTNYQDLNKKFNYHLFEIDQNEKRETSVLITKNNLEHINSIVTDSTYAISGLFSKKKDKPLSGYTYYQINLDTFKLSNYKTTEFKNDYIKKRFSFFNKIDLKHLFVDQFQNTYLVGQFYTETKKSLSNNITTAMNKTFKDFIFVKLSGTGELIWEKTIVTGKEPHYHYGVTENHPFGASYYAFFNKSNINIIVNGEISDYKNQLMIDQSKRKKKSTFNHITITSEGKTASKVIFPNVNSNVIFKTNQPVEINNKVYILGNKNSKRQILLLNIDKQ